MTGISKPKIKSGEKSAIKYATNAERAWEEEGEVALSSIEKTQHDIGAKYARIKISTRKIEGKDARAGGAVYDDLLQELCVDHSIIEDTDKRFIVQTRECPFLSVWERAGEDAPKLCESFGKSFVQGLCESVNPKLRYSVTRMMSKGEPYCEERIELLHT
ncbi:hypothetical protein METP2_01114 [Methanosarcinales archaeon]|nr:hypothetical protein METP2_01114 [Methanosarcinales archaeon]